MSKHVNKKKENLFVFVMMILLLVPLVVRGAIPASEREALIALYNSTGGDTAWWHNEGWKFAPLHTDGFAMPGTEDNWNGVVIENDHVTKLFLQENGLFGPLPAELQNLTQLEELVVSINNVSGSIPPEVGNLPQLWRLDLGYNKITGEIPPELGNLSLLKNLGLSGNKMTGSIPKELGNLANMELLYMDRNDFEGTLPSELGNLSKLRYIYLYDNQLTGSIPSSWGNLSSLVYLWLHNNDLTGNIPAELGNLTNLDDLNLSNNRLEGPIPTELSALKNLSNLNLGDNRLTGTIPPGLGSLESLRYLYLYGNQLTGSIPPELGNLSQLLTLNLIGNQLSGSIPPELGKLNLLFFLKLNDNLLSGPIPSQLGDLINLESLLLTNNQLTGSIPAELGNLDNMYFLSLAKNRLSGLLPPELSRCGLLTSLYLYDNQLSGTIPNQWSDMRNLENLYLSNNHLEGNLPVGFADLHKIRQLRVAGNSFEGNMSDFFATWYNFSYDDSDLNYNAFTFDNTTGWDDTQTVAPTGVSAVSLSSGAVTVSWTPIAYTGDDGGYQVYYSKTSGGPWTYSGITADKTVSSLGVGGLDAGTTYYFVVSTRTEPHIENTNTVVSGYSGEVSASTLPANVTYQMTVQSVPGSGVEISVSPVDNTGINTAGTDFTLVYDTGTQVSMTAPAVTGGNSTFVKWNIDGTDYTQRTVQVTMNSNHTALVYYNAPDLTVNRDRLNFVYVTNGDIPASQNLMINNDGGNVDWIASSNKNWIQVSPGSGSGAGALLVSVDPTGLSTGTYSGLVTINGQTTGQTLNVEISLKVTDSNSGDGPFGVYATPVDGATVYGSIPVTGWVLDDVGVESVKIYRESSNGLVYIGDAVFVEGARPDVERDYPDYPENYRAGWGYMMLTNFLPNSGNGTFNIRAVATDVEGNQVTLGTKTIICDNDNAVKPFGALDTPEQGGIAQGNAFLNWGWALTPQPNMIPVDGSTINVWVDGVNLGHPTYNIYRSDLANLFPGYANSNGAAGYFYLDTTVYENGVHSIHWTVQDDAGNRDGIGSRYFTIQNSGYNEGDSASSVAEAAAKDKIFQGVSLETIADIPDFSRNLTQHTIKELEPIQLDVFGKSLSDGPTGVIGVIGIERIAGIEDNNSVGFLVSGDTLKPLPVGSTFNKTTGKFSWCPGPGFLGHYRFIFLSRVPGQGLTGCEIHINIEPKFDLPLDFKQ